MKNTVNSKNLSQNVGTIHFSGIGGIGMSGIAEILHNLGYKVQGSDISENANVKRLKKLGITVFLSQEDKNVAGSSVVVRSSAVRDDNPEIVAAREHQIPVIQRAEMLAELMRLKQCIAIAGSHGKTTTTSMVAAILDTASYDPTVINGGIINNYDTNAYLGSGDWLVAEADESDGSFLKLPVTIGVITNIDPEHMDHYHSYENLLKAFETFIHHIPFYGFAVMCADHPAVNTLAHQVIDRRVLTYAVNEQADIMASNIRTEEFNTVFDVSISERIEGNTRTIENITLPIPGEHNVENALAAITVAVELGIEADIIKQAFMAFKGVKRRFTKTGEVDGITIIDDYGHHPKEINATLKTAQQVVAESNGNVIAVVQPHRYSRVQELFEDFCSCFDSANTVIVTDIYEAGEKPIEGISKDSLVQGIINNGHQNVHALKSERILADTINDLADPGDIVVCLGAGSISLWANQLPEKLRNLKTG
jgi:UDP-N-acetylmuramate--alanine ligase